MVITQFKLIFIDNYVLLCAGLPAVKIMQNRFIRNISTNTIQLVINQGFSLLIFYALSKWFDKNTFGDINWVLALLLALATILPFGIDKVIVQKVSAGEDKSVLFSSFFIHLLVTGIFFYAVIALCCYFFPGSSPRKNILLFLAIGKFVLLLSIPYKQIVSGLEKFHPLLYMSIGTNVVRGTSLVILGLLHELSLNNVLIIFILGDLIEFLSCVFITRYIPEFPKKINWNFKAYISLLRVSLPQAGTELFAAIMSRFDWIFIGLVLTSSKLAEYSFASKVFEISTLPLLVIQTVLVPLFTRLLTKKHETTPDLSFLLEWKIITGTFLGLMLYQLWIPVIDPVTDGKYGAVNINVIMILCMGMPLMYLNNYLWTINFALGKLKKIFFIMLVSMIVNVASCLVLVPHFKNEGAAFALLLSILVQSPLYMYKTDFSMSNARKLRLFIWPIAACGFVCIANTYFQNNILKVTAPLIIYLLLVLVLKQFRQRDWKTLHAMYQ